MLHDDTLYLNAQRINDTEQIHPVGPASNVDLRLTVATFLAMQQPTLTGCNVKLRRFLQAVDA